jgi:hypothetical protein
MLRWKVRYLTSLRSVQAICSLLLRGLFLKGHCVPVAFTDGAAAGSRAFVDGLYEQCRERFVAKRKSGARKTRGRAAAGAGDLRKGIE